ncbi:metal-dependent transcriptional regulator [Streptomyces sp. AK02-01A]|uniref:metal-dependent transcriptional regulator n=1 Tax=Streptomyces sp. AK02-01A TaxID=3028648 RepID=UPI0029A99207|nr:metal-dependent transcriptional regulator [Streptomyces sp. AK02-01A]MDX3853128.1 metal-dependent transcriptional regulator [Streptomyces sp. AK02-01A]
MNSPHEDLVDTVEMYLRTVYECEEEGRVALRARIGERLGHRAPTVSGTVARMVRDGLLVLTASRELRLTDLGRGKAVSVMRKHRLAERFLGDVVGLAWDQLHPEASRWQHVISDEAERLIAGLLTPPLLCPHGSPIPGLDALGIPSDATRAVPEPQGVREAELLPLSYAALSSAAVQIERIGEVLQRDPPLMRAMERVKVLPGQRVSVESDGYDVIVHSPGGRLDLRVTTADHIFVTRLADT